MHGISIINSNQIRSSLERSETTIPKRTQIRHKQERIGLHKAVQHEEAH